MEGSHNEDKETLGWNSRDLLTQRTLTKALVQVRQSRCTIELLRPKRPGSLLQVLPTEPSTGLSVQLIFNKCLLNQVNSTNSKVNSLFSV